MDFSAWVVDLKTLTATHDSGFRLEIEGNPRDPSAVHPGKFPKGLSSIDQVRLVRTGVEALASESKQARAKSTAAVKKAYVPPANKPKRDTLSFKKSLNRKSTLKPEDETLEEGV
ncbi:MAG: hypothetical protein CL693_04025 [Cellvibrionaceae bacterium]|nr:hypothetical protein [Cellvibrionaceae bacterium]